MSNVDKFGITLLTIVFVTLKLIGQIDWSWWWVLSPLWIYTAFILLIIIVVFIIQYYKRKKIIKGFDNILESKEPKRKSRFQSKLEEAMNKAKQNEK